LRGIGPKRAVELIKQHKTIEAAVKAIDTKVDTHCFLMSHRCFCRSYYIFNVLSFMLFNIGQSKFIIIQVKCNLV